MSRRRKIAAIVGGSLVGLIVAVFLAGVIIVRTDWFRNMVRTKIVAAVEEATGGRVEIGSFTFDWTHLRAQVRDFVVHGLEPANAAPLLRANLLQVDLKLLSPFRGFVDIAYLLVDTPQVNIIVSPDGRTNIPAPKSPSTSNKTAAETIVDLAIGHFDLRNGSATFAERKSELNASGGNLRAQFGYNAVTTRYTGEIDISPLHVRKALNAPVDIDVKLPLTIEKDKITLTAAQIATPHSKIIVSGTMDHLVAPHTAGHLNAQIGLDEVRRAAGLEIPLDTAHGPRVLTADVAASADESRIQVLSARVTLGHSNLEAHGTLQDVNRPGAVQFQSTLAVAELGRLLRVTAHPEGTVVLGGNATLEANHAFHATGNVEGRGLAFQQGATRIAGINLATAVRADQHRIELDNLRVAGLGGNFAGKAAIQNLAEFQLSGNLRSFDLEDLARTFMAKPLGYDGVISGAVTASGSLKNTSTMVAGAKLAIAPGNRGVPVSGRLAANYNARTGNVTVDRSDIELPHTRIDLSGSLGQQIQVRLVSHDLADFRPVAAVPVTFAQAGGLTLDATVSGSIAAPSVTGKLAVDNFAVDGRPFTSLAATIAASKSQASVTDAVLTKGPLQAHFSGSVGLHDWSPQQSDALRVDAMVRNADLGDVLALAGQTGVNATGQFTADANIDGTVGSPRGNANFTVTSGSIEGQRFDSLAANAAMTQNAIDVPALHLIAGASRIDATAHYDHAVNDLTSGRLTAHVASNQVQLAQFQGLVKDRPGLAGEYPSRPHGHRGSDSNAAGQRLRARIADAREVTGRYHGDGRHGGTRRSLQREFRPGGLVDQSEWRFVAGRRSPDRRDRGHVESSDRSGAGDGGPHRSASEGNAQPERQTFGNVAGSARQRYFQRG
jgi:translocation and assembly module TamB